MTMVCDCGKKMKCVESRQRRDNTVWRRHQCSCGEIFSTLETRDVESMEFSAGKPLKIRSHIEKEEIVMAVELLNNAIVQLNKLLI